MVFFECDGSFPVGFVIEWGISFWSVSDLDVLLVAVEVGGVESSDCEVFATNPIFT